MVRRAAGSRSPLGGQDLELTPGDVAVDAADQAREAADALGDPFGMLDDPGGEADDARQDQALVGELRILPLRPLVLVARVAGLEGQASAKLAWSISHL